MDYDVHTVEDVEWLAKELNLRPTNHVCSRAVYNAMRGSPDITAGMEVFRYACAEGALISYSAAQKLINCLVGDANFRLVHPDDIQVAADIFRHQMLTAVDDHSKHRILVAHGPSPLGDYRRDPRCSENHRNSASPIRSSRI